MLYYLIRDSLVCWMEKKEGAATKAKRRFLLFKDNPKFVVIALVFVLSIISISFAAQYVFDNSLHGWEVSIGSFEQSDGLLKGGTPQNNFAYHNSSVAYGSWEWSLLYYGAGSASIIFIGLAPESTYHIATQGYKLHFEVGKPLELLRIDALNESIAIGSKHFTPKPIEEGSEYKITIRRFENNTFVIYIDDVFQFKAEDDTYTTSEVLELDWYRQQQLAWIIVTDSIGTNSWSDSFSNIPSALGGNFFTKVSLYLPFVSIASVVLYFFLRAFLGKGNWSQFVLPLILAIIIGIGYGYLTERFLKAIPDLEPFQPTSETPFTTEPTGNDTAPTFPTIPTDSPSPPAPSPNPSGNNDGEGNFSNAISYILLGVSSVFIISALIIIGIDFFKKRDIEFRERSSRKEHRWIPRAKETDYRKRVIKAYHKSSYDLIDSGAKSKRSMTPGEFALSADKQFALPEKALFHLTDLYEEARFSDHQITEEMSEQAEYFYTKIAKNLHKKEKESE